MSISERWCSFRDLISEKDSTKNFNSSSISRNLHHQKAQCREDKSHQIFVFLYLVIYTFLFWNLISVHERAEFIHQSELIDTVNETMLVWLAFYTCRLSLWSSACLWGGCCSIGEKSFNSTAMSLLLVVFCFCSYLKNNAKVFFHVHLHTVLGHSKGEEVVTCWTLLFSWHLFRRTYGEKLSFD